jgi:glycosyltransferase involved in cell wall biosynthesis
MSQETGIDAGDPPPSPTVEPAGKIVVLVGAGREPAAHCRVLLGALRDLSLETVVVVDRSSGAGEIEAPGVRIAELDDGAPRPGGAFSRVADARRLIRFLAAERPGVLHVIGLEPAAVAGLALKLARVPGVVVHLPDLAALEARSAGFPWPYRKLAVGLLAALVRRPDGFLLTEGAEDLGELRRLGIDPGPRFAVLGGAGVDPDVFPMLPPSQGEMPVAAFVGPVDEASGLRDLMQAFERLWARGLRLQLEIHGAPSSAGPGAKADAWSEERARWGLHPGVRCFGWPEDSREIWRRAEICVWPAYARQGLPRALLEAAACGRALIVTDAAGGRGFVRDGVEGLIVPAQDATALGAALEQLARDAGLRQRMGAAARLRVLQGFTEAHIKEVLRGAYLSLPGAKGVAALDLGDRT